jgi:UDP-N-acetylmuramoylalanine--D-glutamate ligase
VGVLLNISEDHLDRYSGFKDYIESKRRLFINQNTDDVAVINSSDEVIRSFAKTLAGRVMPFGHRTGDQKQNGFGATIWDDHIHIHMTETREMDMDIRDIPMVGKHNMENVSAAVLAALSAGATAEGILSALKSFKGLSHRLEYVDTVDRIDFYDDSKATNVDSVVRALESFHKPVILIMGGQDKGNDYSRMENVVRRQGKRLILIGEAKHQIKAALGHVLSTVLAASMEDAVNLAYGFASPGDVVLLSPACASFDMYTDYAHSGRDFCLAVEQLKCRKK